MAPGRTQRPPWPSGRGGLLLMRAPWDAAPQASGTLWAHLGRPRRRHRRRRGAAEGSPSMPRTFPK
eukprot:3552479-Heterocapsa_arctica.AAC.1